MSAIFRVFSTRFKCTAYRSDAFLPFTRALSVGSARAFGTDTKVISDVLIYLSFDIYFSLTAFIVVLRPTDDI